MEPGRRLVYNRQVGFERFLPFAFVLYCTTVGIALVMIPWTSGWDQMLAFLPWDAAGFLKLPWVRGGLTGFGLVHLVWGFHDLQVLLRANPEDSRTLGHRNSQTLGDQ